MQYLITRYSKQLKVGICGSIMKPVYYDGSEVVELLPESHNGAFKYRFPATSNRVSYKKFAETSKKSCIMVDNYCPF